MSHIADGVNALVKFCHDQSVGAGWWWDPIHKKGLFDQPNIVACKIALIHSEISEALEGDRKGLMDTHLPHRKMIEVELADAMIRIADLAGALKLDLGGAIVEKMDYNAVRDDHKLENRALESGKKY